MHGLGSRPDEILRELISQSYDKFHFEIQNIQVLVSKENEHWEEAIAEGRCTEMHILEPTYMKLSAAVSLLNDDPRLPKFKIECKLPSISVRVLEDRMSDVFSIISTIPMMNNKEFVTKPVSKGLNHVGSSSSLLRLLEDKQPKFQKRIESVQEVHDGVDDVVQFTDFEGVFILEEISIVVWKSKINHESSSDEFGTPSEEFSDDSNTFVSPSRKSITFETPSSMLPNQEKILSIRIKKLEISCTQRTFDLKVDLKLGAVSFDHYRVKNEQKLILKVINTPGFESDLEYLLTLSYLNCKKTSPEFITKYHSVEQLIELKMSTIVLTMNQEGISELIQIANDIQSRMVGSTIYPQQELKDRIDSTTPTKESLPKIIEEIKEQESLKEGKTVKHYEIFYSDM